MVPKNDDSVSAEVDIFSASSAIDEIEKMRMQVRAMRDNMPGDSDIYETLDIVVGELSIALEDLR